MDCLIKQGIDALVFSICTADDKDNPSRLITSVLIPGTKRPKGIVGKIYREWRVNKEIKNIIQSLSEHDVLYTRIFYPSPQLSRILKQPRACKIVIEYQSIEPLEYRLIGKYWYLPIDFLFGNSIRRYTDGIVGVTNEITQYEVARAGDPQKPHITIGNGFAVQSVPVRHSPHYNGENLHILCVASVSRWHGLDRLLQGLSTYRMTLKVTLHIAGNGAELPHLQKLAADLGISDRVIFHGFLTGEPLDALFDLCHIAVGSLGIHRKGLTQTSELKGREYCARGIPYIIACADPDLPADFPYILCPPADESPIDIDQVAAFTKRVFADPNHSERMRHYAEEYLDWSVKMKKLKDFLEMLCEKN